MRRYGLGLLALAAGLLCFPVWAATTNIYVGGSYDGYSRDDQSPKIGCPYVNNAGGATNATPASAWLNGTLVVTGSAATVVQVYWGTANGGTNKGNWAATNDFGVCLEGPLTTNITGLTSSTPYFYRFYATNTAGDAWANASAGFLTPGPPVIVNGAGAAPVSYNTASLNGNLVGGATANVALYWGTNATVWANTNDLGARGEGQLIRLSIAGLSEDTAYYYRCYATNDYGTNWSDTVAFTTRVSAAIFKGFSYDGYADSTNRAWLLRLGKGTVLNIF